MRQAYQTPFGLDLLQAPQGEAAEAARPLDLADTGSTTPLRKSYTARPRGVCTFARICSRAWASLDRAVAAAAVPAGAWCF